MTIIRPAVGAARSFTAGKLTKQLSKKGINYQKDFKDTLITVRYSTPKGDRFTYEFDRETALLVSKNKSSKDYEYRTVWSNGRVDFSMNEKDGRFLRIERTVEQNEQNMIEKFLHRRRQNHTVETTVKNVHEDNGVNGWTKKVYKFFGKSITTVIPHRSYKISFERGLSARFRNVSSDVVDKAISSQIYFTR